MLIVYRMLTSDELGLKQVYEDQGETIQAMCFQLKKYMQINLNEIYKRMESTGVEVEYFALTWLMTWMFHVKTAD